MDTIEALEKTRNYFAKINGGNNPSVYAINAAIKALENQSKYEKALIKYKCMNCNLDSRMCRGKACDNAIKNTFKLAGLEVLP